MLPVCLSVLTLLSPSTQHCPSVSEAQALLGAHGAGEECSTPALPLPCCVTLGRHLAFSGPVTSFGARVAGSTLLSSQLCRNKQKTVRRGASGYQKQNLNFKYSRSFTLTQFYLSLVATMASSSTNSFTQPTVVTGLCARPSGAITTNGPSEPLPAWSQQSGEGI